MDLSRCLIAQAAQRMPDKSALLIEKESLSYATLETLVQRACAALKGMGVSAGNRCAFVATTRLETVVLFFSLLRLRAVACPLSFRATEQERQDALVRLGAQEVQGSFLEGSSRLALEEVGAEQIATCLHTSGTSGRSKIAIHTLGNHLYSALGALSYFGLSAHDRILLSLPLFHVGGIALLFRCFAAGATLVLSQKPLLDALEQAKVTAVSLVPTQLYRLLKEESARIEAVSKHLKCVLIGGAALGRELCQRALERALPLFSSYGMTEMSSLIAAKRMQLPIAQVSVGTPLPFREMALTEEGEILVRGQTLFQGYLPESTQEAWFATRDIGRKTPEGDFEICGRKDRMFISGGENIHPEEIERALCSLPGIEGAHVLAIPDPEFGMRPVAYIEGTAYTLEEVRALLRTTLAPFKHPIQLVHTNFYFKIS